MKKQQLIFQNENIEDNKITIQVIPLSDKD